MKFLGAFRPKNKTSEISEEFNFHLQKQIEKNIAGGMPPNEARRQALISFGGVQQAREQVSEVRWAHWFEVLRQDARYAVRILGKTPLFTAIVVITLSLGIGMNTAIFSLIDSVLFRRMPVSHPEQLVLLRWEAHHNPRLRQHRSFGACQTRFQESDAVGCSFSMPILHAVEAQNGLFSGIAAYSRTGDISLSGNGPASVINSLEYVSGEFFSTLGVTAAAGRTIKREDDSPAAPAVAMLSYGYWQTAFGGAPDVVGRTVSLNRAPFTIVGVAEKAFRGITPQDATDVWVPFSAQPLLSQQFTKDQWASTSWFLAILARLKDDVPRERAEAALNLTFQNETLHGENPIFKAEEKPTLRAVPAQQGLDGGRQRTLEPMYVVMMAVALVLLIACANIGGLLLARATRRSREIAVRLTLGARRSRIISQLLIEGLLMSVVGGLFALLVGRWGARLLLSLAGTGPRGLNLEPQLDFRVMAFTFGLSVLTTLIFSLAPALRSLRVDLTPALKAGSGASESATGRGVWLNLGNGLVVAQVTLAIVALVSAGLLMRTLKNLRASDLGFNPTNVLLFSINARTAGYKPGQLDPLQRDLQEQIAALPGVQSVTYTTMPLASGSLWTTEIHLPGTPEKNTPEADYIGAGRGFFKATQIPLKAGRDFNEADYAIARAQASLPPGADPDVNSPPMPAIVNQKFVQQYLQGREPLGQHIEDPVPEPPSTHRGPGYTIIGVAGNIRDQNMRREMAPTLYVPSSGDEVFMVRTAVDPMSLVPVIRSTFTQRDANLAMFDIKTQQESIDETYTMERLVTQLSTFFALLAVLLACAGIYGLLSYEVTRRTREIGIRIAIGADRVDVLKMVVRHGLVLAIAGAAIGAAASLGATKVLGSLLYQVKARDPFTIAVVAVIVIAVSLFACWLPARRATMVDPLVALRYE
ncbi:MAG TPA: ABC transporter permease [Candidatus Limnocylindrales bacterium]|nr:ABC transporter permease [Candidatus Limnocylindrales bacterium]